MENNDIQLNDEFFNSVALPNNDWQKELEALKINPNETIQPPKPIWNVTINKINCTLGTNGNFSVIIGKAKSKKSFYVNLTLSTYIQNQKSNGEILYFDTEQGKYHFQNAIKKICTKVGFNPKNIQAYHFRKLSPQKRLELIEKAIYNTPNLELVVIDGIKDLITSINDEEQASMITTKLMKWTEELDIHLITVLHQNKSDTNARGHVGTELQNKAETVLSVTKSEESKNISIVEAVYCRNIEPEAFAFEINENGLPNMIDNFKKPETNFKSNGLQVHEVHYSTYVEILTEAFKNNSELKYKDLQIQIDLAIQKISSVDFGITKLQKAIIHLLNLGLIKKNGKDRSPKTFYTFIQDGKIQEDKKNSCENKQIELKL
jgi:predicted ATP-dependent serine protease